MTAPDVSGKADRPAAPGECGATMRCPYCGNFSAHQPDLHARLADAERTMREMDDVNKRDCARLAAAERRAEEAERKTLLFEDGLAVEADELRAMHVRLAAAEEALGLAVEADELRARLAEMEYERGWVNATKDQQPEIDSLRSLWRNAVQANDDLRARLVSIERRTEEAEAEVRRYAASLEHTSSALRDALEPDAPEWTPPDVSNPNKFCPNCGHLVIVHSSSGGTCVGNADRCACKRRLEHWSSDEKTVEPHLKEVVK
jgi:hypothetical protein